MSSGPTLDGLECTKGQDVLSAEIGAHMGSGPTLYGLKLNDAFNGKEYDTFTDILVNSGKCLDIQPDVPVKGKEIFICEGELFAPNGGFGQVFLTSGSIEVFKNRLAPISNWHCK